MGTQLRRNPRSIGAVTDGLNLVGESAAIQIIVTCRHLAVAVSLREPRPVTRPTSERAPNGPQALLWVPWWPAPTGPVPTSNQQSGSWW